MSDDLIKRLQRADEYEPLGHDGWEAATAIAEAQVTIARQQVMLDRALESNGDMMVRIGKLEEALREIVEKDDAGDMMYRADGPFAKIARAALAHGKGE